VLPSAFHHQRHKEKTMATTKVQNGVNVDALLGAREALTKAPEAAKFQWRATCKWVNGTHSRSTVEGFYGLGGEQKHKTLFTFDADHPEIFASEDKGATRGRESAETRERLRSLGYLTVGASPKTEYTAEDDPKRLIALDAMLQEVVGLYSAGDLRSALARCRELVRLRPTMAVSLLHLAHLEREGGDLPAAIAALRQAVALQPDDMVTLSLLGAYLTQAGQAREAAALLEAPARGATPDVDLVIARSLALARIGRAQEALAALAKAREVDSTNPMVLVTAGTVHLMAGDPKSAREAFEAALRLNPKVARAQSSLGMLAGEAGQTEEALAHFQAAVALDPREHAKLVPLGLLLWQRGRPAEGRRYLELFVASAPPALYARDLERVRSWLAGSAPPGR
jgi:tetratricopeptide (TPR) repeat protein